MWGWGFDYPNMMGWNYGSSWIGFLIGGIIVTILIVIAVIAIVKTTRHDYRGVQVHHSTTMAPPGNSTVLRLLDERYAKGEIGDDEYKTKKANLMSR